MRRAKESRWCVMISGTGSNLGALLSGGAHVGLVMSSSPHAFGLLKAKRAGIPTVVLSKPIEWSQVLRDLREYNIDAVFLAGFMKIVPETFLSQFWGPVLNLHPSLLPAYPGLNSIEKAHRDRHGLGCSVHHVIPEVDSGAIVLQRKTKSFESLHDSEFLVHLSEQRLVVEGVKRC